MPSMIKIKDFYITGAICNNVWTPEKVQAIIDAADGKELLWEVDATTGYMVKACAERIWYSSSIGVLLKGEGMPEKGIAYYLFKLGSVVSLDNFDRIKWEAVRLHRERYYAKQRDKAT